MDAEELFEHCIQQHEGRKRGGCRSRDGSYLTKSGLSARVHNCLRRAGFGIGKTENGQLDVVKIRAAVLSGEILDIRNFGTAMLRQLCDWLVKQQ